MFNLGRTDGTMGQNKIWQKPVALWLAVILVALGFSLGTWLGSNTANNFKPQTIIKGVSNTSTTTLGNVNNKTSEVPDYLKKDVDFKLFWEVWNLVKDKYYVKNVADTQLFYGSLEGMVAALNDPYSVFLTPQNSDQFQEDLKGSFEGIGTEIAVKDNKLIIVTPLPDTPAMAAGLRPRDWIIKIDGTSTENMRADQAVTLIRGKKGTTVTLNIYRDGFKEPKDYKIIRDNINVKSLTWEYRDNILYLKTRQFNDDTLPLFDQAIEEMLSKKNVKGIILDLRSNPGGYLESAIEMAGEWADGQPVVIEKLRDGTEVKHQANRPAQLAGFKTVVLVDAGSASASEIVAGALQDYGLAKIVGEKTFGKGSVQELSNLPDGSAIKLTIAKWFTPKGRSIDEQGITPDVSIDLTEEDFNKDRDPQLDKALELLK